MLQKLLEFRPTDPSFSISSLRMQLNRKQMLSPMGLMNIQYAIYEDTVYILEANPRASRTVPLVSKVCNIKMARIATQILLGKKLADFKLKNRTLKHFGV